ncbi:MAG: ribosome biogenesis GTPase Der [Chitinophagales bacterium]|jgi:GTP-binding protein|nr:ribosome biogenesis GTPase Der [Chitinophagales bacterium]
MINKTVAIVGRPNVGKSTLFNRLISERKAIIDDISGVTRDRIYGQVFWNGLEFDLIDTGGYVSNSSDVFEQSIKEQVIIAIEEAEIILFVVDVKTLTTDLDLSVADLLRKSHKPVIVVANKVDNAERGMEAMEFYGLGFEDLFNVSSISGSGTGELLDRVVEIFVSKYPDILKDEEEHVDEKTIPKIAIIGQPNVGKSSTVNALMGENRNIVTPIAGTTRDSVHSLYKKFDKEFILIDTAGIRRKTKVHENLEFYSVIRAVKSIDYANIIVMIIDATKLLEAQDMALIRLAERRKKGLILVVNKWDLIEKDQDTMREYTHKIKEKIAPNVDVPIVFTSAIEKQRIFKLTEEILKVSENLKRKISTSKLNEDFLVSIQTAQAPIHRGNTIKIKYMTQVEASHPTFLLFCNYPNEVPEHYKSFIRNKLRAMYDFNGVPVTLIFKEK